jgi:hypothetical protein
MPDTLERVEEELSWAGLAVAETLRAVELAAIGLLVLLVCPPLFILAVVVIVPAIAVAAVVGMIALPVLAVRHFHRHRAAHVHRHYVARALEKLGIRKRAVDPTP